MKLRVALALLLLAGVAAAAPKRGRKAAVPADPAAPAARALFVESDLDRARALAGAALRKHPTDARLLFVAMESAALAADTRGTLDAAVRLCELRLTDARANVAAARIVQLAANSAAFRDLVPRLERLVATGAPQAAHLRSALLAAAADGVPGLDAAALARDAGILTRWRVTAPFGELSNVDWERAWPPESQPRLAAAYEQGATEDFFFADGNAWLPAYLARPGVFYAESTLAIAEGGEFFVRLESAGTAAVFLDGRAALVKDDRLRRTADIQSVPVRLGPGEHRVLVKFLASAAPFRVAVIARPAPQKPRAAAGGLDAERRYLAAAERYWRGDLAGAIALLGNAAATPADFLAGQAWSRLADASEAAGHWRAAVARSPGALAALYELAAYDLAAGRVEEAAAAADRIVALRPDFPAAQELLAEAAERLGRDRIALRASEARVALRPDCDALRKAVKLFSKSARYDKARAVEERLRDCAPGSLAYADSLRDRGEHAAAARELERILRAEPLQRAARIRLLDALALAGEDTGGTAAELRRIAPNRRAPGARSDEFYASFRRDGVALARQTAARQFSGGPAVTVLHDKVARLNPDGSADEYVHRLTRVLNKEGIERYGEVGLPAGAELLELRTIKPDGRVFEPELLQHKASISMAALAPEDVVEVEYVLHRPARDALTELPDSFRFTFGSFTAPVLYARFAAITPAGRAVDASHTGAARLRTVRAGGTVTRIWELDDIAQSVPEPALPAADNLPTVQLVPAALAWDDLRDAMRDALLEAAHAGGRVEAAAARVRAGRPEETARRVVQYVRQAVRGSDAAALLGEALPAAEQTLAEGEGSRSVAALAIARAAGLEAELLLARRAGAPRPGRAAAGVYDQPLVRFRFREGGEALVDVETEGLGFGELPPGIARDEALAVPLAPPRGEAVVALRAPAEREHSTAEATLALDRGGDAAVELRITMGAWRGAQMRATLRPLRPAERRHFFEQLALRIFPGADRVAGEVHGEDEPGRPLTLIVRCHAPRVADLARLTTEGAVDVDQLVPALGLKRMYATSTARRFALLVETPLFETATFRIELPAGVGVAHVPPPQRIASEFGSYAVEFRRAGARALEVTRSFRIPVQVVAPARYPAFAAFAERIDQAERQRMTLAAAPSSAD